VGRVDKVWHGRYFHRLMCGINGILRLSPDAPAVEERELLATREAMARRGPDGEGLWISPDGTIGLAHRRLAIIDLSDAGLQPMSRDSGRYRIVINGEIYNYRELRERLVRDGEQFVSHSDTEVVLALYARHGARMLSLLRGMYALAIWDERERSLLMARDPYGIKPLYFSTSGGSLRFASQVRALEAGGAIPSDPDPRGLAGFLLWGSVPEPLTLRRAIRAVPAGHLVRVQNGRVHDAEPHHRFGAPAPRETPDPTTALEESVAAHLVADVPVAVFLSAGVDSGLIASLAVKCQGRPITTLTLRFDEYAGTPADEAPLAAEVAKVLGTRHVERRVDRERFLELWPEALRAMDQPSIDGFNTFVVSRLAHEEGIKVVLSGLGGDEMFGSYASFSDVPAWRGAASRLRRLPGIRTVWPRLAAGLVPRKPKLAGLAEYGGSLAGAYYLRRGLFLPRELPRLIGRRMAEEGLGGYDPVADVERHLAAADDDAWTAVHLMESSMYMRNQLLRDSDWASMAHSLELRVPLVDAWLREQMAGFGFEPAKSGGKGLLGRTVAPQLPREMGSRPKSGFGMPVMKWIDGPAARNAAPGEASRRLALRVLESFGIELDAR